MRAAVLAVTANRRRAGYPPGGERICGTGARQAALAECRSRGGSSGCIVRVWGCNGPVVEEALDLDRAARRRIQQDLQSAAFDPGGVDGLFGPRTRAAIRRWQSSRGERSTGYLDGASAAALRTAGGSVPAGAAAAPPAVPAAQQPSPTSAPPAATAAQENLFWQSGAGAPGSHVAASGDASRQPGQVFRDCEACPEMVVLPGSGLALGRYEVTVGEYRAFASATGRGAGGGCTTNGDGDSWRNPGFRQPDRHPVTCVSWDDAQAYVSWLSRTTDASYRLPTEAEWRRAATGSQPGCYQQRTNNWGTCTVGSHGSNAAGLADMVGNLYEWTEDCWEADCGHRVLRGCSWFCSNPESLRPSARLRRAVDARVADAGFRVARTFD